MKNSQPFLPPGFRFHPTDEELILHYLQKKVSSIPLSVPIIAEVDIYKFDPWDLPAMAVFGEKEWYFFSPRDRKYPNGARPNRAAASGYWKATGTDKVITVRPSMGARNKNIGVKKALVFYKGRPPKGTKTSWIMHEYRLTESPCTLKDSSMRLDDWVLCRIYKKQNVLPPGTAMPSIDQGREQEHCFASVQDTKLPSLTSLPANNISNILVPQKSSSFSNLLDQDATNYAMLSSFLFDTSNQTDSLSFLEEPDSTLTHSIAPIDPVDHHSALKRQRLYIEAETSETSSKYPSSTCSFQTSGAALFDVPGQYSYMTNHSFLNHQLLLSPDVQFLG